jgi:hypothetical protein
MIRVRRLAGCVPDTPMDDLSMTLGRPIGTAKDDLGMIFGRARYAGGANDEMREVSEWQSHGR